MSVQEVAKAFVQHFYATFANGAQQLLGLYVSHCLFVFVGGLLRFIALQVQCVHDAYHTLLTRIVA